MNAKYWDDVYRSKMENEVSWFQKIPTKSLKLIDELKLHATDPIIDIGGGDSRLVDELLARGFRNISILDISPTSLEKAKVRLGDSTSTVNFIASDIIKFKPPAKYRLWHDRATFHFLTNIEDVETYLNIAGRAIVPGGFLIVSTFSKTGPEKCSGLPISQYSESELKNVFAKHFTNIRCLEETHTTPWGTDQNFVYCEFKRRLTLAP